MKSYREFIYLTRKLGLFYATYYLFHKVFLKISNFPSIKTYKKNKSEWLSKIFNHLFVFENDVVTINEKQLCRLISNDGKYKEIYLRPLSSDLDVYSQVLKNTDYAPMVEIYRQLFNGNPSLIVDLGANIGLTSVYFSELFKGVTIKAVEPFAENAEMIKLNFEANKVYPYSIFQGGISNSNAKLSLNRKFRDGRDWAINLIEDNEGEIQGYCLKELINSFNQTVDILKIDIEGSEKKLFEKPEYAEAFLSKVKCVVIEIHDEFNCRELIYDAFKASNYFYYEVHDMTIGINKNFL